MRFLTHASPWAPDSATEAARERLLELLTPAGASAPTHWGFVLTAQREPGVGTAAFRVVTASDACWLTGAMVRELGRLRLEDGPMQLVLMDACEHEEMVNFPAVFLRIRMTGYGEKELESDPDRGAMLMPSDVSENGMAFTADHDIIPHGWPR
jgi:hypothetical protein